MNILIINSGSSSIKYQLIQMPAETVICSGMVERIGIADSQVHYKTDNNSISETLFIENHKVGLEKITSFLLDEKVGVIKSKNDIRAVGHRVVHGGSTFSKTTIIDEEVKAKIKELFSLAPLHNPANYQGIEVASELFDTAIQIAVFDTAFHQTMPTEAYKYAIPNKFLEEEQIRSYGFHGTSHKYVSEKAIEMLGKENSKIITIHLGNGCSMTAIKDGKSMDTTLGFGPMNGLIMGTRSGDVDQSVIFYLVEKLGISLKKVNTILQKESGMLGLTGFSDLRDIEANAENGNEECQLALEMNAYRIKKYIGSYAVIMNGLDAIVFTAGIGENSDVIRKLVCTDMEYLGIELNTEINEIRSKENRKINTENSKVDILVIPTNEEIEIAKQSYELIES
ncbi:acetate/propionate family kinase [Aureivirga sp. CE67]|uniref:acetate/propionate family kinase n=1 Tax=Aureivirga sp. CE67 TaxID=1788983 RepID=UPI0018CA3D45|nr:acetate kinase [Aureivirga sp. CE67]